MMINEQIGTSKLTFALSKKGTYTPRITQFNLYDTEQWFHVSWDVWYNYKYADLFYSF